MLSQLLRWWQPSPRVPALALRAGCLTLRRENMKFGAAWRKGHLWMLSASEVFSFFTPRSRSMLPARLCVGSSKPIGWGPALMLWCPKSTFQHPGLVPTIGWSQWGYENTQQAENPPLCSPIIFIILCFETDLLITQFLQALLPSSTESKWTCTIHKQPKIGRTRSRLYVPLAGEAVFLVEAIYKQHWVGISGGMEGAQSALGVAHTNTKYGVTTSRTAWETVLLYLHPCKYYYYQEHVTQCFLQIHSV